MVEKLTEIAAELGIVEGEGEGAAQGHEGVNEVEAEVAGGAEGDDEQEKDQIEPEDGEPEDTGGDEDVSKAPEPSGARCSTSDRAIKKTRETKVITNAANLQQKTTTARSKVAKPGKKPSTAKNTKKASSRRKSSPEPKLRQSAMSKEEKYGNPAYGVAPVPGFGPDERTTDYFGQGPIVSPWVVGEAESARPRYEWGADLSDTESEEEGEDQQDDLGEGQRADPITIDSDVGSSSLDEQDEEDEDNFNDTPDKCPAYRGRKRDDDSDSDFADPSARRPVRPPNQDQGSGQCEGESEGRQPRGQQGQGASAANRTRRRGRGR